MTIFNRTISALAATTCLAMAAATPVSAADVNQGRHYDPKSTVLFWGGNVREDAYTLYAGAAFALNGDISTDGWKIRVFGLYGEYEYRNVVIPGGIVNVDQFSGDIMIGYQWVRDLYKTSIYAGVNFQDRDLTPFDPTSRIAGNETGFKVQGEVRTTASASMFASLLGNFSTANDTYYVRGRVGARLGEIVVGPEGIVLGNEAFDGYRVGAFVGGIPLGHVNMTISGGYSDSDTRGGQDGGYGGVSFSVLF